MNNYRSFCSQTYLSSIDFQFFLIELSTQSRSSTPQSPLTTKTSGTTEIKILTPYGSHIPPPLVVFSSSHCITSDTTTNATSGTCITKDELTDSSENVKSSNERSSELPKTQETIKSEFRRNSSFSTSSSDDTIIPSPLGYDDTDSNTVKYQYPTQQQMAASPPFTPGAYFSTTCSSQNHHLQKNRLHPYSFGFPYRALSPSPKTESYHHQHHHQRQQQQHCPSHHHHHGGNPCLGHHGGGCHTDSMNCSTAAPSTITAAMEEEIKKHQCEFCLKWFQRSSSLSNHRLIHKNTKSFKCNQCNMSFLRKSDLGKHMVTHSGSKPYQCNVCGKRFSQSSNMLTHQRRHTGIRPYSCGICGKAFYRKVDVRRHASVHRNF